jgi:anti-sigma regulatory factor (Ser/Thr protein kinase)
MAESVRITVEEQSQTADARRVARGMARNMGFDESLGEQVAIVVTEACTNLLKHADRGELLLRNTGDDSGGLPALELLVLDQGPGISNLQQCLTDGFSTGGSAGQGLGAIVRLSGETDFYTAGGRGSAVLARWRNTEGKAARRPAVVKSAPMLVGAVNVSKPGQEVCGDSWGVAQSGDVSTFLMADGLGHGLEAKEAAIEAVRMLRLTPDFSPGALIERAHMALRSSRDAAVAVARIDRFDNSVTFAGVGNISAHLYSGGKASQHMVSIHGTAGFQIPKVKEFRYPWPEDGILVMYSDGLSSGTSLEGHPGLAMRDPTLIAGVLYRDFSRRTDDATAMVAKAA